MLNQQPYISGNIVLDEIAAELRKQPAMILASAPPCRNFAYDYAVAHRLIKPEPDNE